MSTATRRSPQHATWVEQSLDAVASAGHRSGAARRAVIESLADQDCCRSAQEIFDQLRADGRRVGIASVYRILELLLGLRLVTRLDLGGGVSRYEPTLPGGEHHHHMVCVGCGEVRPFEDPSLERALTGAARRASYSIDEHDVVLRGRCPNCRED
ncbi:MAG: Fur family transcriptional regulator, ferric uptake regulator [Miltoncostaeaceae bacterium]|nr:Fur family transcriptional regulator, ferric uptake regulator [Miltoncostaeaceae bacterium]